MKKISIVAPLAAAGLLAAGIFIGTLIGRRTAPQPTGGESVQTAQAPQASSMPASAAPSQPSGRPVKSAGEAAQIKVQIEANNTQLAQLGDQIANAQAAALETEEDLRAFPDRIQEQKVHVAELEASIRSHESDAAVQQDLRAAQARGGQVLADAQLASLGDQIRVAEQAVREQEEVIARTVAPENSDWMIGLRAELDRRTTQLRALQTQYSDAFQARITGLGQDADTQAAQFQSSREERMQLVREQSDASAALAELTQQYDQAKAGAANEQKKIQQLQSEQARITGETQDLENRLAASGYQ